MKVQSRFNSKKIGELVCDGAMKFVDNFAVEINGERVAEYKSLDAVAKDWKGYEPTEPLIKDPKTRKAIRAWAEACEISSASVYRSFFDTFLTLKSGVKILSFQVETPKELKFGKTYTITELCGEEEE